jgi:putative ATP-binding cassette transporter
MPLELRLAAGERLLVSGPSGCGKTSLLRVIAGLWPPGEGAVAGPRAGNTLFLPQRPYLPLGSLREQLLVGLDPADRPGDEELWATLERVQLGHLRRRYPDPAAEEDWSQVLSGGEQQRLAIARALLRPWELVLLDESNSALDLPTEALLYGELLARAASLISVGHRCRRAFAAGEARSHEQAA